MNTIYNSDVIYSYKYNYNDIILNGFFYIIFYFNTQITYLYSLPIADNIKIQ